MAAVADAARERGMRVRAIAPTHSAAETLGASIGAESSTVAAVNARPLNRDERKEMWLIDEAGMIAAKDMRDLLAKARRADAQVVLTGDTHQIDSVGAGRAFGQLQVQHLEVTYGLSDIKRQQNAALRQAVYDSLRGDFDAALGQVSTSEIADRDEAIRAIGDEYMRHTAAGRDTIVVPLSRQDRADANAEIQRRLEATGQVTGAQEVRTLQPTQLTGIEQADASRYRVGEVIEAHRNFRGGAKKGQFATVTGVEDGKVLARTAEGREWRFDPQRTDKFSVHERTQTRIGIGDRIVARGNLVARGDDGNQVAVKNNTEMLVEAVSDDKIAVRFKDGRRVEIDTTHGAKVDLAYAQTANQAQGRTADVAIAYMRASQRNLADRQHAYVAMSRAREHATIITDSKAALAKTLGASSRGKDTALDGRRNHLDTQRPLGEYVRKWASDTASRVVEARRERKVEAERSRRMDMARRKSSQKPQERDGRAGKSAQEWEKRDAEFLSRGARERESEILDRATERTARARKAYGINVDMGVLGQLLGSKQTSRGHARLAEIRRQRDASLAQLAEAVGRAQERQMQRAEPRADVAAAGKSGKERGPKLG
jgi:ATP-dependent exoDNAse (exonuclease V) alpha subunit